MDTDRRTIDVFDCIVVGAGISGMCAARALLRADPESRVIVLEASARVGGRTESVDANDEGARIDLGGQWIGHSHQRARDLIKELGLTLQSQFCVGHKVLDLRGHVSTYTGDIPLGVSPFSLLDTHLLMQKIDRMCKLAPTDDPRNSPYAQDWDSQSVGSFMANQSKFDDTEALLTACVRGIFGVEPADISLLHFLTYMHSGGGVESMVKVSRGAQDSTIVGGAQQLCERMVADFGIGEFKVQSSLDIDSTQFNCVIIECENRMAKWC
jgi:monoamine oxidase